MAYNPYFNYQNPYVPQYQPQYQQTQGIIWVDGKIAAQGYNVGAGQSVILMDSNAPYVYKKETAQDGRPLPMETYKLVKENEQEKPKENELKDYIKREEIEDIITDRLNEVVRDEVDRRLSEFTFKPNNRRSKNSED